MIVKILALSLLAGAVPAHAGPAMEALGLATAGAPAKAPEIGQTQELAGESKAAGEQLAGSVGWKAADFSLATVDGKGVSLAQHAGKVVLLDFWASWCPPCRASTPGIVAIHTEYAAKGLVVIGVNSTEPVEVVAEYAKGHGVGYTMAIDSEQKVGRDYLIRYIPTFTLIGKDGRVVWTAVGWGEESQAGLTAAIKGALESK